MQTTSVYFNNVYGSFFHKPRNECANIVTDFSMTRQKNFNKVKFVNT